MAKLSVCLECFYTDLPVEKRIENIAKLGYEGLEFWHPEGTFNGSDIDFSKPKDAAAMKKAAADNGIEINDFAFSAWDGSIGGSPTDKADHSAYFEQIKKMLDFANQVGCSKGIILSGMAKDNLSEQQMLDNLTQAYTKIVDMATDAGVTLIIEPLNSLVDHGGYLLDKTDPAVDIIRKINSPNLKMLYDVYHMQIMQGNIIDFIVKNLDIIGHFHAAGVPGRAELFDTEVNYPAIIKKIDELGYKEYFGLEYFPQMSDHNESLKQVRQYLLG